MNPHADRSSSPLVLLRSIYKNHEIILSLIKRDVVGRYRGSSLGLLWSFFNPVLMLGVYTFVFSMVFKMRWPGGSDSKTEFALVLFAGLLVFNLFAECINRAPNLIVYNVNYVKKVIFPLEILPLVALGSALFHFFVSFLVWLVFYIVFFGLPPETIFWLPVIMIPISLSTLGVSWFLASTGVYIRDVSQMIGVFMTIIMYVSPIFYTVDMLPEEYRFFMHINPLTYVVEQVRDAMIFGRELDSVKWIFQTIASIFIFWIGFSWFQKTRKGFSDVL